MCSVGIEVAVSKVCLLARREERNASVVSSWTVEDRTAYRTSPGNRGRRVLWTEISLLATRFVLVVLNSVCSLTASLKNAMCSGIALQR